MNNWEEMQHVWDHTFRERLKIDPKECNILLTGASHFQCGLRGKPHAPLPPRQIPR